MTVTRLMLLDDFCTEWKRRILVEEARKLLQEYAGERGSVQFLRDSGDIKMVVSARA